MSKAFTKETDDDDDDEQEPLNALPPGTKNYMTRPGYERLKAEFSALLHVERPKIVEIVSWAAGNGDRSENGDYIYGKKRLREIDRRIRYLGKRLENAEVVDPAAREDAGQVFFGASVTVYHETDGEATYRIVGIDEADATAGRISWISPLARALMKAREGDAVRFQSPVGVRVLEVVEIRYAPEEVLLGDE